MIKVYWLEYTFYDHPWKYSLVLYTNWCNLRCYGCHNRLLSWRNYVDDTMNEKIVVDHNQFFNQITNEELILSIKNEMLDMVILCWWEVMIYSVEDIKSMIDFIKSLNPNVLIRIDTNGAFPDKIESIIERGWVDWFAIDIKWPYWDEKYHDTISDVIGIPSASCNKLFERMSQSLVLAKQLPCTLYRTVLYPLVEDQTYFNEIKDYVHNNLWKPHSFNTFVNV